MMDLLICIPVVVFLLPALCLVVKIVQAIQAPGPLFERETRAGLRNRPFRVFSFRTRKVTNDTTPKETTTEQPYPFGPLLRRRGLDQAPQFLNVLLGRMSVVGPQPRQIIHNRRFREIMDKYQVRTFAKPGITGLAQINGFRGEAKTDLDVVEGAKLDIEYIENWSLPLDLSIILKAVMQLLKPPMAGYQRFYSSGTRT